MRASLAVVADGGENRTAGGGGETTKGDTVGRDTAGDAVELATGTVTDPQAVAVTQQTAINRRRI